MIRIAITQAAFDAIADTLPLGSVSYEAEVTADGGRFVWIDRRARAQLDVLRHPDESYSEDLSDVTMRLAVESA